MEKDPVAHDAHPVVEATVTNWPAGQATQEAEEDAPADVAVPVGQLRQVEEPKAGW